MTRLDWNKARPAGRRLSIADEAEREGKDRASRWLDRHMAGPTRSYSAPKKKGRRK